MTLSTPVIVAAVTTKRRAPKLKEGWKKCSCGSKYTNCWGCNKDRAPPPRKANAFHVEAIDLAGYLSELTDEDKEFLAQAALVIDAEKKKTRVVCFHSSTSSFSEPLAHPAFDTAATQSVVSDSWLRKFGVNPSLISSTYPVEVTG